MFDVLGIGVAAVDDIVWVPEFPVPDTKSRILRSVRDCGGLCATALVAAARLGARCAYAGVLGRDEASEYVLRCLAADGIDTSHVARDPSAAPARSIIVIDASTGSRTVLSDSSGARRGDPDWPPEAVLTGTRVLLVDHVRMGASLRAARLARAAGIPVVADLERDDSSHFHELLSLVDHLVISHDFAARLTGLDDPERSTAGLASSDRSVVVTCGADGSWYAGSTGMAGPASGPLAGTVRRTGRKASGIANGSAALIPAAPPAHHPAFDVDVVDTTGCGDVFHGAYAAGLAEGLELADRVRLASATAALAATRPGGQAGIPSREEVDALLAAATGTATGG
jgi:sugar/nucleoside kinase (ribokinase family)